MENICENLQTIQTRIRRAEQKYGYPAGQVQLLAVSKFHPIAALETAYQCKQRAFGENYVQEMQAKAKDLCLEQPAIEWHFIGPIQSNKTKAIANIANWVHSIDRFKIAQRLSNQKPPEREAISICLQVNISGEISKSGVAVADLLPLAQQIQSLEGVKLRGLMAIPAPEPDFTKQRAIFAKIRALYDELNQQGFGLDTLSMGMTNDMEAAIAEGANLVRIGTAIFGKRVVI
jgi:pyridoxal phosphate enzyme (YggS family)